MFNQLNGKTLFLATTLLVTILSGCGQNQSNSSSTLDSSSRLDTVKSRGTLVCGVQGKLPGFSFVDETRVGNIPV